MDSAVTDKKSAVPLFGTNLLGCIESEKKFREAMRAALRSLKAAGIPHVVNNFAIGGSLNWQTGYALSESNPYSTNLVFLSPPKVPEFFARKGEYFSHHFNIGCWSWELPSIPVEWCDSFLYFREIWVPSTFILEAVSKVSPVAVVTLPHSLDLHEPPQGEWTRGHFGLPQRTFVFFFMFDFCSTVERKNPLGLIEAFRRAFGDRTDVLLLIKSVHSASTQNEFSRLNEASRMPNVKLLDGVMSLEAVRGLMGACDCYVSLHRSEGFGLTLAEAMALRKPVIATGYSGNLDYMNRCNSFLVRYRLVEIERDCGPYKKGGHWADPDLDHAAELLQHVFSNRTEAAVIAAQGRKDVLRRFHPAVVGGQIRERLLAASQEEVVRRSQQVIALQKELEERSRELGFAQSGFAGWREEINERVPRESGVTRCALDQQHEERRQERNGELFVVERTPIPPPRFGLGPVPAIPAQSAEFAGCTVVSNNYLARARVLAHSFRKHNPDWPFFVLIVGRVDGYFDPRQEPFFTIEADSLEIPDRERFFFKYNVLEASAAVKPYFLAYLLRRHDLSKVVYLDADILVTHSLARLSLLLDQRSIVLTPHLTAPIQDNMYPGELQVLRAGTYNLGFIGLRRSEVAARMISWWQEKLQHYCLMAPYRGMHAEQRWVDLVPGIFDGVGVLREPGYNVAYWNLHTRHVTVQHDQTLVNGQPCYFFHFSGFDPEDRDVVSRHENRFRLDDVGDARFLFERYRDLMLAAGWRESKSWPYTYDYFDNGARIPDVARRIYWSLGGAASKFGNPFNSHRGSFFRWLNEPVDAEKDASRIVTRLWYEIYMRRGDLWKAFPEVLGAHRAAFLRWIQEYGSRELDVDGCFLPSAFPPTDRESVARPQEAQAPG